MRTDDLINQLASDLKPVKPQLGPLLFAFIFTLVCFLAVCAGLAIVHVRSDWTIQLTNVPFDFDLLSSLGLMLSALALVGRLSSPGRAQSKVMLYATLSFFMAILVFGLLRSAALDPVMISSGTSASGVKCFLTVMVFSLIPFLTIGLALKKRAPLRLKTVGVAMALACISTGTFAITLHCPIDNAMHIALWHFLLPLVVGLATGRWIITKSLRW